jgi:outer membrane receptor for ferrienterochelin and colicin
MAWSIQLALMGVAASAAAQAPASSSVQQLDAVQVTGSRIPRAQVEGPAPITVINAEQIRSSGFTSVPDVLRAMTQNGGETQSQQSSSGADFSPGAQQVDLRGLGPNHTLVLVNGRRIADFPMPFKGRSNFTDVSNIPLGMIERIEVLTGSASAIYGSDAIAGVVNFILKKKADGTTIDMRMGTTTEGGGESFDMSLASGFSRGNFNAVYSVELQSQTRCGPMSATSRTRPRTAPPRARASRAAPTCAPTTTMTTWTRARPPAKRCPARTRAAPTAPTARSTATTAAATARSATAPSSASAAVPTATPR